MNHALTGVMSSIGIGSGNLIIVQSYRSQA